jgi:hypothetical protein
LTIERQSIRSYQAEKVPRTAPSLARSLGITRLETDRVPPELERLSQEMLELRTEIARLRQDNQDLRESAKIWIRLCDSQLARANGAVAELAAVSGDDATDLTTTRRGAAFGQRKRLDGLSDYGNSFLVQSVSVIKA